jgi:hypothetical protein
MKKRAYFLTLLALAITLTSCLSNPVATETPTASEPPGLTPTPLMQAPGGDGPLAALSIDSLLGYVEALAAIQPYSGWRNSATTGEQEAVDYVGGVLDSFTRLKEMGMTVEQEDFNVYMASEIWQAQLRMQVDGQEYVVPVNPPRGPRDDTRIAASFDSDGVLGDRDPDPLTLSGQALLVDSENGLSSLSAAQARDRILFVDYALVDQTLLGKPEAQWRAQQLVRAGAMALVLVTRWSPKPGESHGAFAYDVNNFDLVNDNGTPIVVARLEDMADAGIEALGDLTRVTEATVTVDTDVISPAPSRSLVAMIPGRDDSQAVIVGAHIDSPNGPGALDDASGSAILLEVARVLDQTSYQPDVTICLAWFGSEELYLYGSSEFAARHQDLLDRTIAMLQIDMLSRPLDGLTGIMGFDYWSYSLYGDTSYPFVELLEEEAAKLGIPTQASDSATPVSDNSVFSGFDVPNANLIYWVMGEASAGGIHNAAAIHCPYDTPERVRESSQVFLSMAQLALSTVIDLGERKPELRTMPTDQGRAVFVATQTEPTYMGPSGFTDLSMALEFTGLDVDLVPYGATLSAEDLEGARVAFALPVIDYPSQEARSVDWYDVAWTAGEIEILRQYVEDGGLLVIVNSGHRLKGGYPAMDENEDWSDMNALAGVFGITFRDGTVPGGLASPGPDDHPLLQGVEVIGLAESNAVLFNYEDGQTLAQAQGEPVMALVPYGDAGGEVLVIGDANILRTQWSGESPRNLQFWLNLAEYGLER